MDGGVGRQQGGGVGRKDAQYVYMPSPLCIDMGICFYVLPAVCGDMLKRILAVLVFFVVFEDFLRNFEVFFDYKLLD